MNCFHFESKFKIIKIYIYIFFFEGGGGAGVVGGWGTRVSELFLQRI